MNLITDRGDLLRGQVQVLVEVVRASLNDEGLLEAGEDAADRAFRDIAAEQLVMPGPDLGGVERAHQARGCLARIDEIRDRRMGECSWILVNVVRSGGLQPVHASRVRA
jgi:hypothetical protein